MIFTNKIANKNSCTIGFTGVNMEIIKYKSDLELKIAAEKLKKTAFIIDTKDTLSFRTYDENNNTKELHLYFWK